MVVMHSRAAFLVDSSGEELRKGLKVCLKLAPRIIDWSRDADRRAAESAAAEAAPTAAAAEAMVGKKNADDAKLNLGGSGLQGRSGAVKRERSPRPANS